MTITKEGAIASFYTVNKAPIKHLKVYFSPKQGGSGNPSPENVREINGWNNIETRIAGKNLASAEQVYGILSTCERTEKDGKQCVVFRANQTGQYDKIKFKPNTQYTISCDAIVDYFPTYDSYSSYAIFFKFYYTDGTSSGNLHLVPSEGWQHFTVTSSSTKTIQAIGAYSTEYRLRTYIDINTFQIEEGAQATIYEPYKGTTQTIDWSNTLDTIYGGYIDLITGELVQEQIGKTFKGSDADQIVEYTNTTRRRFRFYKALKGNSETKAGITYCDQLQYRYHENDTLHYYFTANNSNGNVYAYLPKDFGDNDEVTIVASLYTPELVATLSPMELQTFIGRNNIWSNADRVEVEYDLAESNDELYRRRNIILQEAPHIESTSNEIANFQTDMITPLKEAKIYFNPIQDGEGDPSPSNVRPIIGWTGLNLYQTGRNLINVNELTGTTSVWWKGKDVTGYPNHCVTPLIPVKPGTEYYLNRNSSQQSYVNYFDKDQQYIEQVVWDSYTPNGIKQIPDNVYYVGITIGIDYVDSAIFQIAEQNTSYIPFNSSIITPINWINWHQLIIDGTFSDSSKWWAANSTYGTLSLSNNIATWTCTAAPQYYYQTGITERSNHLEIPENHKVYVCAQVRSSIAERIALYALVGVNEHTSPFYTNVNANEWTDLYGLVPTRASGKIIGKGKVCYGTSTANISNITVGTTLEAKNFMMFDLTQMFGAGNEPTAEEFHKTFTNSYYIYNPGLFNTDTAPILYKGYFDLITGELIATHMCMHFDGSLDEQWWVYDIGTYSGFGLSGLANIMKIDLRSQGQANWLKVDTQKEVNAANKFRCWLGVQNTFIYCVGVSDILSENTLAAWKTYLASNPLDIVFPLAEPIHYPLTPQTLKTFKGTNNIWSDANGPVSITYWTH